MKISEAVVHTKPTPALDRLLKILRHLPNDEVFTQQELETQFRAPTARHYARHPRLVPHRYLHAGTLFLGSEKGIQNFRKELERGR